MHPAQDSIKMSSPDVDGPAGRCVPWSWRF